MSACGLTMLSHLYPLGIADTPLTLWYNALTTAYVMAAMKQAAESRMVVARKKEGDGCSR
jgi:hypothetical protein